MHIKKVQKSIIQVAMVIFALGFVPGCIKYHETLPTEFPQGNVKKDNRDITANYVKSVCIYDQFVTRAIFDALWLSDDVRIAYANMYCSKRGKSADDTEAFITRQREENNHWTTFYVLADVRDRQGTSLSDKNAPWTFYLKIGDYKAAALSVKELDLEPEFQALFGKHYNSFKTAYMVKFPVRDVGQARESKKAEAVQFVIESVDKSVVLEWSPVDAKDTKSKEKVLRDEDFYWC